MRRTIVETGTLRCVHCRRLCRASDRMTKHFLQDVFGRKSKYNFARIVLGDPEFATELVDFLHENKMDCRSLVRVLPWDDYHDAESQALAQAVVRRLPELFRELPRALRECGAVASVAVGLLPKNIEMCEHPILTYEMVETVVKETGLRHLGYTLDLDFTEGQKTKLYETALKIPGNTDIIRMHEPTRKQWLLAVKSTPVLMCRIPFSFDPSSVNDVVQLCKDSQSVAVYEELSEDMRSDQILAAHLLQLQLQLDLNFNFLQFILFKPSFEFTVLALQTCPAGLKYAGAGDYSRADALDCVQSDGMLLQYSRYKDDEMCMAAVTQNGLALQHVPSPELKLKLQLAAIRQNKTAVQWADRSNPAVVEMAMPEYVKLYGVDDKVSAASLVRATKEDPDFLRHVKAEDQTLELARLGTHEYVADFYTKNVPDLASASASASASRPLKNWFRRPEMLLSNFMERRAVK